MDTADNGTKKIKLDQELVTLGRHSGTLAVRQPSKRVLVTVASGGTNEPPTMMSMGLNPHGRASESKMRRRKRHPTYHRLEATPLPQPGVITLSAASRNLGYT